LKLLTKSKYLKVARSLAYNRVKGEAIYPFYASFKVTWRCNFRCEFCDVWRRRTDDLATGDVKRILDDLASSSVVLVSFEGGEPLLREDIGQILEYASRLPIYILFTTSERELESYPMERYCRYIDFLHISIDEGHRNLEMFDRLEDLAGLGSELCVQTVVRREDIGSLEPKVRACHRAGAKILIMPAVHLDGTRDHFPDPGEFRDVCFRLKKRYPGTIITPDGYLRKFSNPGGCTTDSIIIDSDGWLFYPCRVMGNKVVNLLETPLEEFLRSERAAECRDMMRRCRRRCGWYQYFATSCYVSPSGFLAAMRPYL